MFALLFYVSYLYVFFFLMIRRPPRSTLFPTRRSSDLGAPDRRRRLFVRKRLRGARHQRRVPRARSRDVPANRPPPRAPRASTVDGRWASAFDGLTRRADTTSRSTTSSRSARGRVLRRRIGLREPEVLLRGRKIR